MSRGHNKNGHGHMRKPGEWKTIAIGRSRVPRALVNGTGLSNIPSLTDVGSAAYRRLLRKVK